MSVDNKGKVVGIGGSGVNPHKVLESLENIKPNLVIDEDNKVPYYSGKDTPINAFDGEGDEYANATREELLAELGKTGIGSETVKAKVVEDMVTGEKISKKVTDEEDAIKSLQDLSPEQLRMQLSNMAKQNLTLLLGGSVSEDVVEKLIEDLEKRIVDISRETIESMTVENVRDFLGTNIYDAIRRMNINPASTAKKFLLELKDSIVEVNGLIDTMDELNKAMEFFKKNGIADIQSELQKQLDENGVEYMTDLHRYVDYLKLYIERLSNNEEYEGHDFVKAEIEVSQEKIKAITEAFTFERILSKVRNSGDKIRKELRNMKNVEKVICDFIGKLQSDETITVSFPLPKHLTDKQRADSKQLTIIWVLFLEMVDMQYKFPVLQEISFADYGDIADIVNGVKAVPVQKETEDDYTFDRLTNLQKFAEEHKITKAHFVDSKKMAFAFTYILARTFKPTKLNDTYTKYVLSYTMNILSQSLKPGYRELTHELLGNLEKQLSQV